MKRVVCVDTLRLHCAAQRAAGRRIALVPTMGCFHAGHLALMRWARQHADVLVVSLFVNPTQFGPKEDLASYPSDLERDASLAAAEGADLLFHPQADSMYSPGHCTWVDVPNLGASLCGESRPSHFRGVCTIVTKLFHLVLPHLAVFGQKDWQQVAVIKRMVADLNFDVEIVDRPTVREPDGLAMSSRNAYLTQEERAAAPALHAGLQWAQEQVDAGEVGAQALANRLRAWYALALKTGRLDYIALVHPETLVPASVVDAPTLLAVACRLGKARLIDNILLLPRS